MTEYASPRPLYEEDISELSLKIHDWLQVTPLAATEEGYDYLADLVSAFLDPFCNGYRSFN
jgi:hypothetical protein